MKKMSQKSANLCVRALAQSFSPLGIVKQVCLCSCSSKTLPAYSTILTYLKYAPVCLIISALTLALF